MTRRLRLSHLAFQSGGRTAKHLFRSETHTISLPSCDTRDSSVAHDLISNTRESGLSWLRFGEIVCLPKISTNIKPDSAVFL
jgi:hypothetical protein